MKATAVVGCLLALALAACDRSLPVAGSAEAAHGASATEALDSLPPTAAGNLPAAAESRGSAVSPQDRSAYAAMEDQYMGDSVAQWAVSAKASTSFGERGEVAPGTYMESRAWKATGQVDGNTWSNDQKNSGVDWLELGFAHAVRTGEIRVVMVGKAAVMAITRVDVIEEGGQPHTIWEGPSEVLPDQRGNRTWFVRQFDKTPYKVLGVKLTFGNQIAPGFKEVDAVQLVGR
jgi:hypothetical protein